VKTWKNKEVQLTEWLNGNPWPATRKSRALRGEAVEDIEWGPVSVELKTRANFPPQYLLDWLTQAERNAEGKVPALIIHKDATRLGNQLIILRLSDFCALVRKE
jgi:hypothetical protein